MKKVCYMLAVILLVLSVSAGLADEEEYTLANFRFVIFSPSNMRSNFNNGISRYYKEFTGKDAYSTSVTSDLHVSKDYINSTDEKVVYKNLRGTFMMVFYCEDEYEHTEKVEITADTSSRNDWGLLPFRIYTAIIDDIQAYCNEPTNLYQWAASGGYYTYYGNVYKATYTSSGFKDTIVITATKHNVFKVDKKDPTCTEDGWITTWSCTACHRLFLDPEATQEISRNSIFLSATGHSLIPIEKEEATCSHPGHEACWKCEKCDKLFSDQAGKNEITAASEILPAHHLEKHNEIKPTCTEPGIQAYWQCTVCRKMFSDEAVTKEIDSPVVIPAKGHDLACKEEKQASCTETGTEAYWQCSVCKKLFSDEMAAKEIENPVEIPLAKHILTEHAGTEASCKETGTEAYWECTVCGKLFSDADAGKEIDKPIVIQLDDHQLKKHAKVEASCKETGTEAYWECTVCGKLFADGKALREMDHPVTIPLSEHTPEIQRMIVPTYDREGLSEGIRCSVCGEILKEQEVLPRLERPLPGDVNGDRVVDGRDVLRLMKWLAGEEDPETGEIFVIHEDNADVDASGNVDEKDLLRLVRYMSGENVKLE